MIWVQEKKEGNIAMKQNFPMRLVKGPPPKKKIERNNNPIAIFPPFFDR